MGYLPCPCTLPLRSKDEESDSLRTHSDHLDSSDSSLSSQPSLPSVPSLTLPSQQPTTTANHHCISTLKGHSSYIFSLTLAGKYLYSGSSDSEIRLWPRKPSSENLNIISGHSTIASSESAVKSLVFYGDKLFSGHQDNKIRVWKIDTKNPYRKIKCVSTLPTLNDRVMKLFLPKNYVKVRRHKQCTWVNHVDAVSALAVSKDGSLIYSGSWDRTFKVWRTSDFKCLESVWNAHDDAINAITVSLDGFVYTGSADRKIKVWREERNGGERKHRLVDTLEKHKSAVNALALSTDGSVLYSGACDRSIIVWEKDGGDGGCGGGARWHMVVAGALRGHTKAILCIGAVSDLVCSGSADKTVRIWRRGVGKSYSCVAVLEGHKGPVKCLAAAVDSCDSTSVSADGTSYLVYTGSLNCDIKIWKVWVPFL